MSGPDAADRYAEWVEATKAENFPAGDDMSDLAALGETRYKDVPADDVARRVTKAREHGREWWQIAQYLGLTERQARIAYGTAEERRNASRPRLAELVTELVEAIRDALGSGPGTVREHSRH